MKRTGNNLLYLLLITFTLFSCNEIWDLGKTPTGEGIQNVFIPLSLPFKNQQAALRSMDANAEENIRTVDVLSFKTENNKLYFDYHAPVSSENINTNGFKVALKIKPDQHLVIIANAQQKVSELVAQIENSGEASEKDVMLSQLTFELPESGKWNTGLDYAALPMWGETDQNITVDINSSTAPTITLLRMVAKIDVVLDVVNNAGLAAKFQLKSVRLYNYASKGRIIPDTDKVKIENNNKIATAPSFPVDYNRVTPVFADYNDFSTPSIANEAMKGVIYAFETHSEFDKPLEATCLVIGGLYDGSTTPTYYRVDFVPKSNKNTLLDILRNHSYTITIADVSGKGYDTPDEAFSHKGVNIAVEILDWSAIGYSQMENVIFDDYYFMSVNRDSFAFSNGAVLLKKSTNIIKIITDHPQGWTIKSIVNGITGETLGDDSWIGLSGKSDTEIKSLQDPTLFIKLQPYSAINPNATRTAIITVKAGRLEYPIKVVQYNIEPVSVELFTDQKYSVPLQSVVYHYFTSASTSTSGNLRFHIRWKPKQAPLVINSSIVQTGIPFVNYLTNPAFGVVENGGIAESVDPQGLATYTMTSPQVTSSEWTQGYRKAARIIFSVSNGIETEEKTLTLWHIYGEQP
ncbi:hypothetical protein FACS189413_07300 [Bacteroidia bacterium]|nr:hypothetical protein FACS189413_07300 [Bacteroidia bacterium]